MPQLQREFDELIRRLTDSGVQFVLIGGLAMIAHGSAHVTKDIDLGYARVPENLNAIVDALQDSRPRLRVGADGELPFIWDARTLKAGLNFTLRTEYGDIDLLGEIPGVESFQALWDRSVVIGVAGRQVRVASVDDLISMKRAAGRPQDLNHIEVLLTLRGQSGANPTE